jgi:uncharacterized protein (TIGR02452 family)
MDKTFNNTEWLRKFNAAADKHDLRAEIFRQTLAFVNAGEYSVGNRTVKIDSANVAEKSEFFDREFRLPAKQASHSTRFQVIEADCLETAQLLVNAGFSPCVLNLASRRNPGGGVLGGAGAQEENLFRRSNLFRSLYQYASYSEQYGIPKNEQQYPLDQNFGGVYSPDITVFRGSEHSGYRLLTTPFKTAFVTVAAISHPDTELKDGKIVLSHNMFEPTKRKMRTIARIAGRYDHDALVLGAFGCGAFRNPPDYIAAFFREVFEEEEFAGRFRVVVFAIIDDHNSRHAHNPQGNVLPFQAVFE